MPRPLPTNGENRAAPFPLPPRERALPLGEPKASLEAKGEGASPGEGDPHP